MSSSGMGVLDGRIALVTGASRGIGAEIARRFAAEGATVVATARTAEPGGSPLAGSLADTVAGIEAAGGTARAVAADVSRAADRVALVERVLAEHGRVDVLVNNAAVTWFLPIAEFPAKRVDLMFAVQVKAPLHLAQLVDISSRAAIHPQLPPAGRISRGGTVYGMCKAALERFTTGLAAEVHADGIAVNALSPNRVVATPGTVFHRLTTDDSPDAEPPAVMAEAALALCRAGEPRLTGRVAFSQDLLAELGIAVP